jgi:stearoyl-CoA desaturase (delta-9 desaturase)
LLALGEGWHNNHHAFPRSALHGLRWWQFDLSGLTIRLLEWLRLIWNVQRASSGEISTRLHRTSQQQPA